MTPEELKAHNLAHQEKYDKINAAEDLKQANKAARTKVRIPTQMPPADPKWMIDKWQGKALSGEDFMEHQQWKLD